MLVADSVDAHVLEALTVAYVIDGHIHPDAMDVADGDFAHVCLKQRNKLSVNKGIAHGPSLALVPHPFMGGGVQSRGLLRRR